MTDNIVSMDALIGKTVLSRATGNALGQVYDLYIDPIEGVLMGLTIQAPNGKFGGLDYKNVYSFGQDAVMANDDDSVVIIDDAWVANHSHAKKHLLGTKIVTESGKLLGQVANIFVRLSAPPAAFYEVRESVLDKLLGRNLFLPASTGSALSRNAERIVVSDAAAATAAPSLSELANRSATQTTKHNALIIPMPDEGEEKTTER